MEMELMENDENTNLMTSGKCRASCDYLLKSKIELNYDSSLNLAIKSVNPLKQKRSDFVSSVGGTLDTDQLCFQRGSTHLLMSTMGQIFVSMNDESIACVSNSTASSPNSSSDGVSSSASCILLRKRECNTDNMLEMPTVYKKMLEKHRFRSVAVYVSTKEINRCVRKHRLFALKSSFNNIVSDVYEVEKILGVRRSCGKVWYLMKWKNYSYDVSSWEGDATGCMELLQEYRTRQRNLNAVCLKDPKAEPLLFYKRFLRKSFFFCQAWEDELIAACVRSGHAPIYIENWVDDNLRLKNFKFITTNEISEEARKQFIAIEDLMFCTCESRKCGSRQNCCSDIFGMKYPYTSSGRLRQLFDVNNEWLVECADGCTCGLNCPTRVVQRGRQIPIVIFRTLDRGWSVRTLANIRANTFVMEYVGEVVTLKHAQQSKLATYQFEMDACKECAFVVDALKCGNEARFVNHSCDPNMKVLGVFSDRYDMRYHRIAYFSLRDITKGEELTINYFSKHSDDEFKRLTKYKTNKNCLCKAKNCRGFII